MGAGAIRLSDDRSRKRAKATVQRVAKRRRSEGIFGKSLLSGQVREASQASFPDSGPPDGRPGDRKRPSPHVETTGVLYDDGAKRPAKDIAPSARTRPGSLLFVLVLLLIGSPHAQAQPRGARHDADRQRDMATFQFLLRHRADINRKVTKRADGVETVTESNVPEVAAKLHEHVAAMRQRLKDQRPIHLRDPLFGEVFRNADKVTMTVEKTEKGLKVIETSEDPYVARLIQAHADVINQFLAKGHEEVRKKHPPPSRDGS